MPSQPPNIEPVVYDPRGAFVEGGITQDDIERLTPRLQQARREMLDDLEQYRLGTTIPQAKRPLDAAFLDLPERLLKAYSENREESELGCILRTAARLRESVDSVVVLGIGGSYMGARALMDACCNPYHNELTPADRGRRPRLYFGGNNVDNDATRDLINLLQSRHSASNDPERWAIIVISKSGGTLETAVAFRHFLSALRDTLEGDDELLGELVVPVTGTEGKLYELSRAIGCRDIFSVPDGVGGRFSALSSVGLLPAAVLGIDVVRLLTGAAEMNRRFRTAKSDGDPVMNYVAVSHLMETTRNAQTRILSAWSNGLESFGLWYDQLLSESLGKNESGALPLTVVNTRDLHSRGQQHQEGRRDKMITNLILESVRHSPLTIQQSEWNHDQLNQLRDKSLLDIMSAAIAGTNQAYNESGRPTANLHLPRADEATLGQLFQMFMLATVLEGRLIGINPYGQPGVEAYKQNMNVILRNETGA